MTRPKGVGAQIGKNSQTMRPTEPAKCTVCGGSAGRCDCRLRSVVSTTLRAPRAPNERGEASLASASILPKGGDMQGMPAAGEPNWLVRRYRATRDWINDTFARLTPHVPPTRRTIRRRGGYAIADSVVCRLGPMTLALAAWATALVIIWPPLGGMGWLHFGTVVRGILALLSAVLLTIWTRQYLVWRCRIIILLKGQVLFYDVPSGFWGNWTTEPEPIEPGGMLEASYPAWHLSRGARFLRWATRIGQVGYSTDHSSNVLLRWVFFPKVRVKRLYRTGAVQLREKDSGPAINDGSHDVI